jgi:AAA domain
MKEVTMSAFAKPTSLKSALNLALYGPAGSGKTFSALLLGEGLVRNGSRRVAVLDTEQGTAFYSQAVPTRKAHPQAFDFDVLHTKSVTEALAALHALDPAEHGVVIVDSISHIWDACRNAYAGKLTKYGGIPLHAWATIKRPYKEMMNLLLSLPVHVIFCGRQGIDYGEDEGTGELKQVGFRLRAEGETGYEPDVLVRLESHKANRKAPATILAHVEKDRTGVLAGATIEWPTFDKLAKPLLGLLGSKQAAVPSDDEVAMKDVDALERQEEDRRQRSAEMAADYAARIAEANTADELRHVGQKLTLEVKSQLTPADLERVRQIYGKRQTALKATPRAPANATS